MIPDMATPLESERTAALVALYEEFDADVSAFAEVGGISCPLGCGDCCDHADTEVTVTEARLIAEHIRAEMPALEDELATTARHPDRVACVFYDPDRDFHCRIYSVRPLICRAFGYSAYSDRAGNHLFAVCPSMPIAKRVGGVMPVLFEPYPPVVDHYRSRILAIAERYEKTNSRKPLGRAVLAMLEKMRRS